MKKLLITAIFVTIAAAAFYIFYPTLQNDEVGTITVIVVDQIGDIVSEQRIGFTEEDTLFDIMDQHYDIGCANNQYQLSDSCEKLLLGSRVLLQIDDLETDWLHNYIGIYINDEYSNMGIDLIPLEDNNVYRFEFTEVGGDIT